MRVPTGISGLLQGKSGGLVRGWPIRRALHGAISRGKAGKSKGRRS